MLTRKSATLYNLPIQISEKENAVCKLENRVGDGKSFRYAAYMLYGLYNVDFHIFPTGTDQNEVCHNYHDYTTD